MLASRRLAGVALLVAFLLPACGGGGGASFAITALGLTGETPDKYAAASVAGGEEFQVMGRGFEAGATVRFGDTPAVLVTFISETELRVVTPAMPEGTVDIVVTNPDEATATRRSAVTFAVPPTVLAVMTLTGAGTGSPNVPVDETAEIEVAGTGFKDGADVYLDGQRVTTTFVDPNAVRFMAPARPTEDEVDVTVRNPEGLAATMDDGLHYSQEFSLEPQLGAMGTAQLRHLLRRGGFGAAEDVVAARLVTTRAETVDWLLDVSRTAEVAQVEATALDVFGETPPPSGEINTRTQQEWWIHLVRNNPMLFQERLCFFLHDHFATSQTGLDSDERWWMHEQIELFRRFGLPASEGGLDYDWQRLLVEVCKDRAMLEWLDGNNSRKGAPNENFARELWELFMLGEGRGYTQEDIVQASLAFTGFDDIDVEETDYETVIYRAGRHDESAKTIFGVTGFFGYDSISPYHEDGATIETDPRDVDGGIVALTLRERPVEASTFICRKLATFLLFDDPSDEVVDELAQLLRDSAWNLKPVLRRMLLSKAMYSSRAMKSQIKSPFEFVFQFVRSTDIAVTESRLRGALDTLQQEPLEPPGVDGWPSGAAWMGGQAMLERINFLRDVVRDLDDTPTQIHPLVPPAGQRAPVQLVDHIASLLDVTLTDEARTRLVAYVTTTIEDEQAVPYDFDPTDDRDLRMKTRGLLYLIAQYYDGHRQ